MRAVRELQLFRFCDRGHLGRQGTDDVCNVCNPGGEADHRIADGLDVAFVIGNVPH